MHRESGGLRSADLHLRKLHDRDRMATMQLDLPLTCRHVEAPGASDLQRDLIAVDCGSNLHREALLSELHQEASEGSPADASTEMVHSIVIKRAIAIGRAIFIGLRKYHDPIATRSWPNRHAIVVRSWCNHGHHHLNLMATIIVRSWPSTPPSNQIERSGFVAEILPLKTDVSPLSFLTFDRYLKKLRKFRGWS